MVGNTGEMDRGYHSLYNVTNYDQENVEVSFVSGSYEEVWRDKTAEGAPGTIFAFRSPYRYNSGIKIEETRAMADIALNDYGASTTVALDQKMEMNYRRLLAKFNRYRDEHDVKPSKAREKIIGDLNKAISTCLDLAITDLGDVESGRGTIYFAKSDQSAKFEYDVLSSGEKEVLDILLDIYLRQDDYADSVFLIDEPELHISTGIQRKLLQEIDNLVGADCQIWVATHSIGFLRALQEDIRDCQIIFFPPETDFATSRQVLTPNAKTRRQWLVMFETALDDLAGLLCPRRLIYCEGKAESKDGLERGLDAQAYNNIFGEVEYDTLFVSSGGNTEPEQRSRIALATLRKALVDVQVLVLSDGDIGSGQPMTEEERKKHLEGDRNRRILRRRELENYLYDEEVLRRYSEVNGHVFDERGYEEAVADVKTDNLKDITGRIKLLCGEQRSISPDKFKLELSKCIAADMAVFEELRDCIF